MSLQRTIQMTMPSHRRQRNETDNNWQGDEIRHEPVHNVTRIMFHNINGITLKGTEGLDMIVNEQASMHVDIQAISEHCLDTTKCQVTHTMAEILRTKYAGPSLAQFNSSLESALHSYKPGGTGLLLIGTTTSRLEPNGRGGDDMGRWSYVHLRRKRSPPLTIIAAYQVCPNPTHQVGNTAYHQQERMLQKQGRHNLHPRRAFIQDLSEFITSLIAKSHDIILGGDFNEALTDRNSGILHLATRHQLVDPFLLKFPQHEDFGTYALGQRRIDITLMTPRVFNTLKG